MQSSSKLRKNYYETLGLKPDASADEIDKAYKKLSSEWHPDKHKTNRKEAESKFHGICEAYDVLSNKNRREHYDQVSHRDYTNDDADKTFERFFEQHGMEDENQKKFFDQHYPNRKRNYYQVLGVPKNASVDEIKKAYRKLSLQYHPKNNPGKEEQVRKQFNEVNEAYNALSTDSRRNNYDIVSFGQIAPIRAHNIFENFWGDRFNELEEADEFFRPVLRNKWSRKLDRMFDEGDRQDWSNVKQGQTQKTQTYYTNKNGVQTKKTVTTNTKIKDGIPTSETTEEYQFPDGNREIRKIKDDGRGNVTSNVYNLKKGQNLPIEN